MEFSVKCNSPEKQRSGCLVVGVFESRKLSAAGQALDKASGGHLTALLRHGDMDGRSGQTLLVHNVPKLQSERVLLVGCGKESEFNDAAYRKAVASATVTLKDTGASDAHVYLSELPLKGRDNYWKVRDCVQSIADGFYVFDQLKSKKDKPHRALKKITLMVASRHDLSEGEAAITDGKAIAAGMRLAKDLGNLPGNVCTPTYLANQAKTLQEAVDQTACDRAGMKRRWKNSAWVRCCRSRAAAGNRQNSSSWIIAAVPKAAKPVVLVGKGVTFDSGGISLKPGASMDEMKFDMCGAASVFGALKACLDMELPLNVVGIVPATENMPDGAGHQTGRHRHQHVRSNH